MKRVKQLLLVALIVCFTSIWGFSTQSYAAELSSPSGTLVNARISAFGKNGKYFDHISYANTYPDLYALYGYNKSALWKHYVTLGVYENRAALGTTPSVTAKLQPLYLVSSIVNDSMSDREKAQAIHDWIINNTVYDYANYLAGTIPAVSYTKEGVFANHVAVCAGYADAFSYLAKLAGLNCENVDGVAYSDGSSGDHAWNRVLIDGTWLYLDCTFDDPVCSDGSNTLTYNYFLVPYEVISADHIQQAVYKKY